ncbi:MAG: formate dehydrogenase [Gammaproteobacteria bacterium]|jgi:nitrous oxide reductase|nr:formate dehydrogenase [Gammaproteobacteria bacterium]NCF80996.1 formate dehydrogenase [Pseudomonadota bacterium]
MSKTPKVATGRRAFLKRAAVAGGAATVAVAGGAAVADVASESQGKAVPEDASKGYRITPHIEAYYRSTRD